MELLRLCNMFQQSHNLYNTPTNLCCSILLESQHIPRLLYLARQPLSPRVVPGNRERPISTAVSPKYLPKVVRYAKAILAMLWHHEELRVEYARAGFSEGDFIPPRTRRAASRIRGAPFTQSERIRPALSARYSIYDTPCLSLVNICLQFSWYSMSMTLILKRC